MGGGTLYMSSAMKPLALTMGEPAGIGAEIAAGAWRLLRDGGPRFVLIAAARRAFGGPVRPVLSLIHI